MDRFPSPSGEGARRADEAREVRQRTIPLIAGVWGEA